MTRNQELGICFYLRKATEDGKFAKGSTDIDLERAYEGLTYVSADGLLDFGKPKNIYQEQYADSGRLRVWHPSDNKEIVNGVLDSSPIEVTHDATKVKFTFAIIGENRQSIYDKFYEDITRGFWYYWDNKRKKYLHFFFDDEYKPSEDLWYGSTPWIKLEIEVQNIWGKTFNEAPQTEI